MQTVIYSFYLVATGLVFGYFITRRDAVGLVMMAVATVMGALLESMNSVAASERSAIYVRYSPEFLESTQVLRIPILIALGWSGFVGICYFALTRFPWFRNSSGDWRTFIVAVLFVPFFSLIFELMMFTSGTWTWHHPDSLPTWLPVAIGALSLSCVYWASSLIGWLVAARIPSLLRAQNDVG